MGDEARGGGVVEFLAEAEVGEGVLEEVEDGDGDGDGVGGGVGAGEELQTHFCQEVVSVQAVVDEHLQHVSIGFGVPFDSVADDTLCEDPMSTPSPTGSPSSRIM